MGLLRIVQAECPDRLEEMIEASFQYIWRDGHSVKSEEDLKDLASRCFQGDQLSSLIKKAYARDTRALLKAESEQLVENGAFGFPYVWPVIAYNAAGWLLIVLLVRIHALRTYHSTTHPAVLAWSSWRYALRARSRLTAQRLAAFLHKPYLGPMADGTTPRL